MKTKMENLRFYITNERSNGACDLIITNEHYEIVNCLEEIVFAAIYVALTNKGLDTQAFCIEDQIISLPVSELSDDDELWNNLALDVNLDWIKCHLAVGPVHSNSEQLLRLNQAVENAA